jgi:N-acetyl-gamma-glutamyl-phosphate reductase
MTEAQHKVRVGVVGASGYSGIELVRLLLSHPGVQLTYLTGHREVADSVDHVFPHVAGQLNSPFVPFHLEDCIDACETVFLALPSGVSGTIAHQLWSRGKRVIDLSGDLRLPADTYARWYPHEPVDPRFQGLAVYGLTEWQRDNVKAARVISNPGCYATAALLGLLPTVRGGLWNADYPIVIDAKSGVSGAGRSPTQQVHFGELGENFYAYKVGCHPHVPEIERQLGEGAQDKVMLTTQLFPCIRGIYASCYVPVAEEVSEADIRALYETAYQSEPFVKVCPPQTVPQLQHVRGSNQCLMGLHVDERTRVLQIFSALDNLQKGAAGQALQNFNIAYGFPEETGLSRIALYP